MKISKELYEKIEAYLNKDLSDAETKAFEKAMERDDALREEVNIHSDLYKTLGDEEENAFVDTVYTIVENKQVESKPSNLFRNLFFFGLLFIGVAMVFGTLNKNEKDETIQPSVTLNNDNSIERKTTDAIEQKPSVESDEELKIEKNTEVEIPTKPMANTEIEQVSEKPGQEMVSPRTQVAEVDYSVNETLEMLMGSVNRSESADIEIINEPKDQIIASEDVYVFDLKIEVNEKTTYLLDDLVVYIFSNSKKAYKDFLPLLESSPEIEKNENVWTIGLKKNLRLNPGLYYYIVEEKESEELLLVKKFKLTSAED